MRVFRYWWNKDDPARRFMIGMRYCDHPVVKIIDARGGEPVEIPLPQLDEFIAALQRVRDTVNHEPGETPDFEAPSEPVPGYEFDEDCGEFVEKETGDDYLNL